MNESNELRNREVPNHPVDGETATLISADQVEHLRQQWTNVQSHFVDEPRKSVEEADQLVAAAIKQIEDGFSEGRSNLEKQWSRGDQASTEDLRICLQHYRQFFDRLLTRA
jgi:hypothetical protein